jgi:hypothetical protein
LVPVAFFYCIANYGLRPANEGCSPTATAHSSRSILWSRKHSPALWALHNPSLRMSGIYPYIIRLEYKTPTLHCLRSAPDETTLLRDFRFTRLTATTESSIPHGSRFLGPSTIYLCVHDRLQGHLRRHIFEYSRWLVDFRRASSPDLLDVASNPGAGEISAWTTPCNETKPTPLK